MIELDNDPGIELCQRFLGPLENLEVETVDIDLDTIEPRQIQFADHRIDRREIVRHPLRGPTPDPIDILFDRACDGAKRALQGNNVFAPVKGDIRVELLDRLRRLESEYA